MGFLTDKTNLSKATIHLLSNQKFAPSVAKMVILLMYATKIKHVYPFGHKFHNTIVQEDNILIEELTSPNSISLTLSSIKSLLTCLGNPVIELSRFKSIQYDMFQLINLRKVVLFFFFS
ncbi:hypothetical protein V8G54_029075 [Vigna mungo]|uniref:Uncharacterized protein n=1 Tax=Vigna mungo TaxID=3915 RepID=A0AAQ3MSN3_VIGMU